MSGAIIGSTAYGTGSTTDSQQASSQLSADFDTFLLLLTAQLQNQDPLEPTDSTEFTNQLVQYANVEQAIQTNSNLESMIGLNVSNLATNAVSYIGKEVQVDTAAFPLQDGYGKFSYTLPEDGTMATAIIYDAAGDIVHSFSVDSMAGKHILDWDGKTSSGEQLPDGIYRFDVSAMDQAGEMMASENIYITTYGKVTSVASDGVDIAVGMGDVVVTLDRLLSIHETTDYVPPSVDDGSGDDSGGTDGGTDTGGSTEGEGGSGGDSTDTATGDTTPDEETTTG